MILTRVDEHKSVSVEHNQTAEKGWRRPCCPAEAQVSHMPNRSQRSHGTTRSKQWSSITIRAKWLYFCNAVWFLVSNSEEIYFGCYQNRISCFLLRGVLFSAINVKFLFVSVKGLKFLLYLTTTGISPTLCLLSKVSVHQSERLNVGMHLCLFTSLLRKPIKHLCHHVRSCNPVKLKF